MSTYSHDFQDPSKYQMMGSTIRTHEQRMQAPRADSTHQSPTHNNDGRSDNSRPLPSRQADISASYKETMDKSTSYDDRWAKNSRSSPPKDYTGTGRNKTTGYNSHTTNTYDTGMDWDSGYGGTWKVSSWSKDDMEQYRKGYPGKIDDLILKENAKFYLGERECNPDHVKIDEILRDWKGNYRELERKHGYIQWLFPIREQGMNSQSYELQLHEAQAIMSNRAAMERYIKAYELMLDFYGFKLVDKKTGEISRSKDWKSRLQNLNISSHNNLRITRILKSLGEFGLEHFKIHLVLTLLRECTEEGTIPNCKRSCYEYWSKTLRNKNAFERAQEEADFLEEVVSNEIAGPSYRSESNAEYVFWKHALTLESLEASKQFEDEVRKAAQDGRRSLRANQWRKIFSSSSKTSGLQTKTSNGRAGTTVRSTSGTWTVGDKVDKTTYTPNALGHANTRSAAKSADELCDTKVRCYKDAVHAIMGKITAKRNQKQLATLSENVKAVMAEKKSMIFKRGGSIHNSHLLQLWQMVLSVCQQ